MNATLRVTIFSQDSHKGSTIAQLSIRYIDPSIVPAELTNTTVVWHDAVSISYGADDHTLVIEKSTMDCATTFTKLVGSTIGRMRDRLAETNTNEDLGPIREIELNVPDNTIEAIMARVSGYIDDTLTDESDNDALGKLLGLANTDFGAADLFLETPLDVISMEDAVHLV